jgi:hypothetical protein
MYLGVIDPNRAYGPNGEMGTCLYGPTPRNADGSLADATCPGPSFMQANPAVATIAGLFFSPYGLMITIPAFLLYYLTREKR